MLHPSYTDLMKVVNSEVEPGEAPVVNSRYSIVMATAKRARQIIAGDEPRSARAMSMPLSAIFRLWLPLCSSCSASLKLS